MQKVVACCLLVEIGCNSECMQNALNVLTCVSRTYRAPRKLSSVSIPDLHGRRISNGGWYIPEDFSARLSALTRRLHEACTTKRHASSHFAYNRDKNLLVFWGKYCPVRRATYSSTFCTTVVSEEIVSRYLSWGAERRELRWNRKMSLVISRWRYARLGERLENKASRRKFWSSFKLYLKTSSTLSILSICM